MLREMILYDYDIRTYFNLIQCTVLEGFFSEGHMQNNVYLMLK